MSTFDSSNDSVSFILSKSISFFLFGFNFLKELSDSWNLIPPVLVIVSKVELNLSVCIVKHLDQIFSPAFVVFEFVPISFKDTNSHRLYLLDFFSVS